MQDSLNNEHLQVRFSQDRNNIVTGGNRYMWNRHRGAFFVRVFIGLAIIFFSLKPFVEVLLENDFRRIVGTSIVMIIPSIFGVFLIAAAFNYGKRIYRLHLKGGYEFSDVTLICEPEFFISQTPLSESKTKWCGIAGYTICNDGVLVYPHFASFYWIPKGANFYDSSFEEFVERIKTKVTCKLG